MSTELTVIQKSFNELEAKLEKNKNIILNVIPAGMRVEEIMQVALNATRRNPKLLECTQGSLLNSIIQASQLGLKIDPVLGHAHLVPYGKECQLITGYKGFVHLARSSGMVKDIFAKIVYSNEAFELEYGITPKLKHIPQPPATRGNEIIGAYAVAVLTDGNYSFDFMWDTELELTKTKALAKKFNAESSPWTTHPEEMKKKTVIRRLAKMLPMIYSLSKAAALDELAEEGLSQRDMAFDDEIIDVASESVAEKTEAKTEKLAEKLAAPEKPNTGYTPATAQPATSAQLEELAAIFAERNIDAKEAFRKRFGDNVDPATITEPMATSWLAALRAEKKREVK